MGRHLQRPTPHSHWPSLTLPSSFTDKNEPDKITAPPSPNCPSLQRSTQHYGPGPLSNSSPSITLFITPGDSAVPPHSPHLQPVHHCHPGEKVIGEVLPEQSSASESIPHRTCTSQLPVVFPWTCSTYSTGSMHILKAFLEAGAAGPQSSGDELRGFALHFSDVSFIMAWMCGDMTGRQRWRATSGGSQ